MKRTALTGFLVCAGGFTGASCWAQGHSVDISVGESTISNDNYDKSSVRYISYSYKLSDYYISLGHSQSTGFEYENVSVSVSSILLSAGKQIDFTSFQLELEGGFAYSTARATSSESVNYVIGTDSSYGPMAALDIVKKCNNLVSVHAGVLYVAEVSGTSLSMLNAGIRFTF